MIGTGNSKVVNIRGTSGSGKSTLARRIRDHYTGPTRTFYEEGRKRPIGTVHDHRDPNQNSLALIGHYETACGGTDTVPNMDHIFDLVRQSQAAGFDVLFEGLLISADFNRTLALHEQLEERFLVVGLDMPLEVCLESINERRYKAWQERCGRLERQWQEKASRAASKGKAEPKKPDFPASPDPVPEKNTKSKWTAVRNGMPKLEAAGIQTAFVGRDQAYRRICNHFGLEPIL